MSLSGIKRQADKLYIRPCIPDEWPSFEVNYRYGNSFYYITVQNSKKDGSMVLSLDEKELAESFIPLTDDGGVHQVKVDL